MFKILVFITLFITLISVVVKKVLNLFKQQKEEHEKRMAMLTENLKFQEKILASIKNPVAAAAVGGATTMFLLDQLTNDNNLEQQTIDQMQDMDLDQLQEFAMENNFMEQEDMNHLLDEFDPFDPYTNPGIDIVIDESYHGIDHGLDNDFHDDFDYGFDNDSFDNTNFDNDFGGGFGNDF
ncbi:hypothetical protein SAMN00017405_1056 [Desulfonispora thiosulfatigenes DSM 11270]|uniref:Uncharacterized protein n=1 Tax=Desulfonispora thiosulfatigenes DSM 11270 TaxID=656914 RepID=A0A1W1UR43_DESTI|nr:hypothetical protein [Desulfonispora thiosulfatigenes]SMB83540.1 hypothetical protein SAMN00017405_1056 [Desulfonispora thiosulfatigenes DSM 11270]